MKSQNSERGKILVSIAAIHSDQFLFLLTVYCEETALNELLSREEGNEHPICCFVNGKVEWLIIKEQNVIYFVGTVILSVRTTQRAPT